MAKTRKSRRRKHRGTQAGTVERTPSRGATTAKPAKPRNRQEARAQAEQRRLARLDQPPTWKSSLTRAGIAAALLVVLMITVLEQPVTVALGFGAFALLIYVPLGYLFDGFFYRRRQRQKARSGGGRPGAGR